MAYTELIWLAAYNIFIFEIILWYKFSTHRSPHDTASPLRLGHILMFSTSHFLFFFDAKAAGRRNAPQPYVQLWTADFAGNSLLAIMLGRLRMSLDDCQDAYLNLSERIFQPVRSSANVAGRLVDFVQANGKFDASRLEECVKQILKDQGKKESELLKEDDTDTCKV